MKRTRKRIRDGKKSKKGRQQIWVNVGGIKNVNRE
jgi:hypothetical protein